MKLRAPDSDPDDTGLVTAEVIGKVIQRVAERHGSNTHTGMKRYYLNKQSMDFGLTTFGSLDAAGEAGAVAKKLDKDLTPAELAQMMRDLDTVSPQAIRRCL